jgi:ABC-type transporter Mla subunit MlaD
MRRVVILIVVAAVVVAGALALRGSSDSSKSLTYRVELDNASGLTKGADLRAAGVKVGSIDSLDVQARSAKAIAVVKVDRPEFGGLRTDASCVVKPQSLIGEYFMDCDPGVARRRLRSGGTVPISRTAGTVAPDIVLDVMRKPYRERLGILLAELGQGFAARGGDVNETIRRAIPALRETDRVLVLLSRERQTLAQLTRDSATTFGRLDGNRDDVARFVAEARDTAVISANRRRELAGTIRRLPTFERALRPTLRDLGVAARRQTPALVDLQAAAPSLTTLLNRLGPFADASRPAIRALGRASTTGTKAVADARGFVSSLRAVAAVTKEPITNLRYILEHIDDRGNAVEKNVNSPGGLGFTGLEAFLQFFFEQSQAINLFDDRGYLLRINLLINECSNYTNGSSALANPGRTKRCSGALGPGGKIEPTPGRASARKASRAANARAAATPVANTSTTTPSAAPAPAQGTTPASTTPATGATPATPAPAPAPAPAPGGNPAANLLGYLLG